ncbi:glycosyltransferase family 1 protein [Hypoxylon sp. NC1633]|nr:glycosyltransferase family 1 protein [Hypoxylon sp. NC1633]
MTSQPQLSHRRPGNPRNGHDGYSAESSSSSSAPVLQTRNISPPPRSSMPTVEEPPSPTVDDIAAQANIIDPLVQDHQHCVVEMETDRHVNANRPGGPSAFIYLLARQYWMVISHRNFQFLVVVCLILCFISPYLSLIGLLTFILYRHYELSCSRPGRTIPFLPLPVSKTARYILIVCGSGGHTGEMIRMFDRSVTAEPLLHRRWAMAYEDEMSYDKVMDFEHRLALRLMDQGSRPGTFDIKYFRRGRAVHQSWSTTPFTALVSFVDTFDVLTTTTSRGDQVYEYPAIIVTDGPASGFFALLAARILKVFCLVPESCMKTIFIESWARVTSLSLSGRLIKYLNLADIFILQYRDLATRHRQTYTRNMVAMPYRPPIPMQ